MRITDIDRLCWYVAKEVVGRLGFVDCVVYRYDPDQQVLVQTAAIGEKTPEQEVITNKLIIPLGKGITGQVAKTGQAEVVDDLCQDERYIVDLMEARSEICVPLIHDGKILGVIDCEDPSENVFTDRHLASLTAIASITSVQMAQCELMGQLTRLSGDLKIALNESQAAHRAQAVFLANVSHELRTPLNAIVGFSTILSQGQVGPEDNTTVIEYAQHIHQAGVHLTGIVNDILDITALESEMAKTVKTKFQVRNQIEKAMNLISAKAGACGIAISVRGNGVVGTAVFDQRHFTQILTNLIDNAIKYGASGKRIEIRTTQRDGASLAIAVKDFGAGISADTLMHVFEPFARDQAVVDAGIEGTGLGLCLARELAQANGGDIEVQSTLGEGSTFTLIVPAAS